VLPIGVYPDAAIRDLLLLHVRAIPEVRCRNGMRAGMKTYRVTLTTGRQILVKADRWARHGNAIQFLSSHAEMERFYTVSVERIEDCTMGVPSRPEYLRPGLPPEMR
jgi:hypothetical protein